MTVSLADIDRWDPGDVREVFHAARSRAEIAINASDGLASLPAFTTWGGDAAEAAREAIGRSRKDLDTHGNEALAVARVADKAADDIENLKRKLEQLREDASRMGMQVNAATNSVTPAPGSKMPPMEVLLKTSRLQSELNAIVAEAVAIDDELASAINMAGGTEPIPDTPHDNRPEIQDALSKPLPEDPQQFNDLWEQLTQEEKDWLYSQDHNIGNHPGMPFADKDKYNRQHLTDLIQTTQTDVGRMQQRYDELARSVYTGDTSAVTGNELAALGPQLAAARHNLDGYRAVRGSLDAQDGVPRYLGLIDDQGHAAVSIGNPDTAARTATFVPGTGQDLAAFEGSDRKSWDMFQAVLDADPSLSQGDVAVTTWMGYDRPMDLTEAAWPGRAENGGAALDTFLNGMTASHAGPPAIDTVIGHSYGSTLVGAAATDGNHLGADNVIAVGSPGMLTETAGGLSLDQGANVYSMTARNDIISLATDMTLGADPYGTDFGATRLWTDPGSALPYSGGVLPSVPAHSSYWDEGNPGLANMGSIIAGLPPPQIVTPDGVVTNP
ncbi:MAG: alpha/beta hydrolase [Mycobacterium sp.]